MPPSKIASARVIRSTRIDIPNVATPYIPDEAPAWAHELKRAHDDLLETHQSAVEMHNRLNETLLQVVNGGMSIAHMALAKYLDISFQLPFDPPWVFMSGTTGDWAYVPPFPRCLMLPGGIVWFQLGFTNTGSGVVDYAGANNTLAQMPAGYFPTDNAGRALFACGGLNVDSTISTNVISISNTGLIQLIYSSAAGGNEGVLANQMMSMSNGTPSSFVGFGAPTNKANAAPTPFARPWPIVVKHGFDRPCGGLTLVQCRMVGQTNQQACGAPVVDWHDLGDGTLQIDSVWGLSWGQAYNARVLVTAEV